MTSSFAGSSEALDWLFAQQERGIHPGLERIRHLLSLLGNPERSFSSVQVGGTNGKGSATRVLSSILQASGWGPVGEYTSPHLHRFSERIRVDGFEISGDELVEIAGRLADLHHQVPATFFELITAMAFKHFEGRGVRWAVLEVGLGGRLDATTAAPVEASIITGVSLDHTGVLGSTVGEIAREKAGIIRAGKPVFTGASGVALDVIYSRASELSAPVFVLGEEVRFSVEVTSGQRELTVLTPAGRARGPLLLPGAFQARNAALAVAAALSLGVGEEGVGKGLAAARWPGRLELIPGAPAVLLDASHNPEGAVALAEYVTSNLEGPVTLVIAGMADKDLAGIAEALGPIEARVIATRPRNVPRAASPETVARHYPGALVAPDPDSALAVARAVTPPDGLVVVAGTIPLVAQVREILLAVPGEDRPRMQ